MDNQHQHIKGYRDLTAEEVGQLVEKLREKLAPVEADMAPVQVGGETVMAVVGFESFEAQRWLTIGQDHLQQGFMALTRAVARPTTF